MFALCTAISTDADVVCAGGLSNVLHMYTLNGPASGPWVASLVGDFEGHGGYVSCAKFFVDKREVLSSSGDGTLACWDVSRGAGSGGGLPRAHRRRERVRRVVRRARVFASCSTDGTVKFWDKRSGSTTGTVRLSEGDDLSQIGFVPGSSTTVACSVAGEGRGENHGQFLVIDARAMAKLASFRGDRERALRQHVRRVVRARAACSSAARPTTTTRRTCSCSTSTAARTRPRSSRRGTCAPATSR